MWHVSLQDVASFINISGYIDCNVANFIHISCDHKMACFNDISGDCNVANFINISGVYILEMFH